MSEKPRYPTPASGVAPRKPPPRASTGTELIGETFGEREPTAVREIRESKEDRQRLARLSQGYDKLITETLPQLSSKIGETQVGIAEVKGNVEGIQGIVEAIKEINDRQTGLLDRQTGLLEKALGAHVDTTLLVNHANIDLGRKRAETEMGEQQATAALQRQELQLASALKRDAIRTAISWLFGGAGLTAAIAYLVQHC